ncbi:hypothetical protein OPV22_011109 [Ensete ventricosum]|uniref:Uncharacterized protein n=1 Tax=Ensete ventricosum TaxID=4639 RepID=A0AAV8RH44_ENSVE|nr:hypothetical protein OPV22_011109 [Ensete ventricosum]
MQRIARIRSLRLLPTSPLPLVRAASSSTTGRTADIAVHSEGPQGDDAEEAAKAAAAEEKQRKERKEEDRELPHSLSDKIPPFAPSPKLESHEVVPPGAPSLQQKRRLSHQPEPAVFADVACVGLDGTPLHREQQKEEEDFKEYYEHHKPSPLAEIEFADTRKPITRATDGGASYDVDLGPGRGVMVEETVDEALARAEAMFRERAMTGVPDLPHSWALRRMLREMDQRVHGSSGLQSMT